MIMVNSDHQHQFMISPVHKTLRLYVGDNIAGCALVLIKISLKELNCVPFLNFLMDNFFDRFCCLIRSEPGWTFLWWAHPTPSLTPSPVGTSWGRWIISIIVLPIVLCQFISSVATSLAVSHPEISNRQYISSAEGVGLYQLYSVNLYHQLVHP